jgi:hypothetical protein
MTAKVTAPSPDPPDVSNVIAVPTLPISIAYKIVSVAWPTGAAVNVNVLGSLVAAR